MHKSICRGFSALSHFVKILLGVSMALLFIGLVPSLALADEEDPSVSDEARYAQALNLQTELTPEDYIDLMNADPTFNIKAYMYYNEDLMSMYTYSYWQYYKHYLEKGIAEKRPHFFPPDDLYNTVTLGRYTTKYNDRIPRGTNLTLAADFMNGTIVLPGETFSYNQAVGKRTSQRGFVKAHIFVGKEIVDGIGGGICQVSTTTYVAMMIAGIPATERHKHSLPVTYVKPNLDATVNWGTLDLQFVNPYDFPIMVNADAHNGLCTVSINKVVLPNIQ